ncbi:MAG TPA: cytoplasmic protein [Acidimicrobiia bacterium]|nr:cytoplasmic protein [Acidimicrobiia bacterium]
MKERRPLARSGKEADALLEEILVDAYGDDEQLWALRQAFEDEVPLPADAFVIGEPVCVVAIDYDGNTRRGLTATCRREQGGEHTVSASEVLFREGSPGARYTAAYRKWLGLEPLGLEAGPRGSRRHKAAEEDFEASGPVELAVLATWETAARCRFLGAERELTLRSGGIWSVVPGEIVTVQARKRWRYAGHPYLAGDIEGRRLDVAALGLTPLRLDDQGVWDPSQEYWGEEGEPLEQWARPIVARGSRPALEMEQVLPGQDPDEPDDDPIVQASELNAGGDPRGARRILMNLLASDLRCLDAHAHLGNFAFDHRPEEALRHYEVGIRIAELSLGGGFDGVLSWGDLDNRPFLRCLHGYGLCLWRLGRPEQAAGVFERMLWLNPGDNQGARFLLPAARAGAPWEDGHVELFRLRLPGEAPE